MTNYQRVENLLEKEPEARKLENSLRVLSYLVNEYHHIKLDKGIIKDILTWDRARRRVMENHEEWQEKDYQKTKLELEGNMMAELDYEVNHPLTNAGTSQKRNS